MDSSNTCIGTKEWNPRSVASDILKEAKLLGYPNSLMTSQSFSANLTVNDDYTNIINCVDTIMDTQEKLNKLQSEMVAHNIYNPSMINHPSLMKEKIHQLTEEHERIKLIIEHLAQIQVCLQRQQNESQLPIHVNHHKAVIELCRMMPKNVTELKGNLENLEWLIQFRSTNDVDKLSTLITQIYAQLQSVTRNLQEFHNCLMNLQRIRGDSKTRSSHIFLP